MKEQIQVLLDKVCCGRTTQDSRSVALNALEKLIASLLLSEARNQQTELDEFIKLQDSFECNVPSRIFAWLSSQVLRIGRGLEEESIHKSDNAETHQVATIVMALSLVQGVALLHKPSKEFLGREFAIEILLELLLVSRHLSKRTASSTSATPARGSPTTRSQDASLASAVLDTLLCILVDSPPAIRVFEELEGVDTVVKILKRAGIPRDTRMKCLEFIYFYLMDESAECAIQQDGSAPTEVPTRPSSPSKDAAHGLQRFTSSTSTAVSFTSTFSDTSTLAPSFSLGPTITLGPSPPSSPTKKSRKPRSLAMLQKEVDFVPLSPKKAQVSQLGLKRERPTIVPMKLPGNIPKHQAPDRTISEDWHDSLCESTSSKKHTLRTTDEKREILGQLLGNVDALVEGVKKAGIWGLS